MGKCADECAAGRAVGAEDELHAVSFVCRLVRGFNNLLTLLSGCGRLVDFQTTFLCLMLRGRGHSPRYFFSVLGRLETGKAGFITTIVAWALPAELTCRFGVIPSPIPSPTGRGDGLVGKLQVAKKPKTVES